MIKKTSAIVLGLVLIVSAVALNGNADVNYAKILDEKITTDRTLRVFSGGIRRGTSNKYESKFTEEKVVDKKMGLIRPRTIKSTTDVSPLKVRRNTNRINALSASRSNKVIETAREKQQIKKVSFESSDFNIQHTENFVLELNNSLTIQSTSTGSFSAKSVNDIKFSVVKLPSISEDISFESIARGIATAQLNKNLDLSDSSQAIKIVSQVGKNHVMINQTPPTYFFDKVSVTKKYGTSFAVVQRVQQDPNGGFYYLEVVGPNKYIQDIINIANQSFKSFNLK